MAFDLQQFQVTENPGPPITHTISCLIVDSQTGAVLHDITGANAVVLETYLGTLTRAQRLELLRQLVIDAIRQRFSL